MSFIRGTVLHSLPPIIPARLQQMTKLGCCTVTLQPAKQVEARIQKIVMRQLTRQAIIEIREMLSQNIVPVSSKEVKVNPWHHIVTINDFFLHCIDDGKSELVDDLCDYGFKPIPEQIVPQKQVDRTWKMIGSCRPDPLLYSIFKNRMDIAKILLNHYDVNDSYCFPVSTVYVNMNKVSPRTPSDLEMSPLTVALMLPENGTIEETREKVRTLLALNAQKHILPFRHPDQNKYSEDSSEQKLFLRQLEDRRLGLKTYLEKCF